MNLQLKDYNLPSTKALLKAAEKDTDPASIIYFGEDPRNAPEFAVIVIKGTAPVKMAAAELERLKLYTPGKPIVEGMPIRGSELP